MQPDHFIHSDRIRQPILLRCTVNALLCFTLSFPLFALAEPLQDMPENEQIQERGIPNRSFLQSGSGLPTGKRQLEGGGRPGLPALKSGSPNTPQVQGGGVPGRLKFNKALSGLPRRLLPVMHRNLASLRSESSQIGMLLNNPRSQSTKSIIPLVQKMKQQVGSLSQTVRDLHAWYGEHGDKHRFKISQAMTTHVSRLNKSIAEMEKSNDRTVMERYTKSVMSTVLTLGKQVDSIQPPSSGAVGPCF